MDALAKHIAERLQTRKSCTAFEAELSRAFPVNGKEEQRRIAAIQAFAKERGWTANIQNPGLLVTFRKAKD